MRKGNISENDFLWNSEILCLDVTVSALSSFVGQAAIPIPVLGAIIGNAVGMFLYQIAKDTLARKEQQKSQDIFVKSENLICVLRPNIIHLSTC